MTIKRELPVKIPLYEQIYTYVLNEIRGGRLKRGDRVPSESELSEQFNVSRITSKKALEMLEQQGIVARTRGKGSFVRQDLPENALLHTPDAPELIQRFDAPDGVVGATGAIGVIMPDMGESFGITTLYVIQEYAAAQGYNIALWFSHENQATEEKAIRALLRFGVHGLIIMPVHGEFYNAELVQLVFDGFPIVLVDRYLAGIPAAAVFTNHRQAARDLTEHLIARGHRGIAFLSAPARNTSSIEERIQGYTAALVAHGITVRPDYVLTRLTNMAKPANATKVVDDIALLIDFIQAHSEITAFVACEYNIALLLIRALDQLHKRIPDDYAIVCFDTPDNQFIDMSFTYVRQDEVTIGQTAVDMLIDQIHRPAGEKAPAIANQRMIDFNIIRGRTS